MTDLSKFKDAFLDEAEDLVQKLNSDLLILEKIYNEKNKKAEKNNILNNIMRSFHTLKSSSASMGYMKTSNITHALEDKIDEARNGKIILNSEIINNFFILVDGLTKSIENIKKNNSELDYELENKIIKKIFLNENSNNKELLVEKNNKNKNEVSLKNDNNEDFKIDYIKVPVKRLDLMLDLIEELIIDRMKLERLRDRLPELKDLYDHINVLISNVQYQIMQSRLVPLDQIFSRFPRMIRDISKKLQKTIEFNISGGEVEIDRAIVDKLFEPLVHLLRNALDHGIIKEGTINLGAIRDKNFVLIFVENDCQGLNIDKIKQAAVKRSIISKDDLNKLNKEQAIDLIFNPNLSTKENITELSGRGVGLSVVKNFTDSVGGKVLIENNEKSVKFILKLPLSIAIINSLLVEVSENIYAIPFSNVDKTINIFKENINKMADNEVAVVDDIDIPLFRLNKIFNLNNVVKKNKNIEESEEVVLVKKGNDTIGLVIDNVLGEKEIIVKPLAPILRGFKNFSGSTILGDGRVALIIDVINLS